MKKNIQQLIFRHIKKKYHLNKDLLDSSKGTTQYDSRKIFVKEKRRYNELLREIITLIDRETITNQKLKKGNIKVDNYQFLSINGDSLGKVISWNGRIYRGIYRESTIAFEKLWRTGLLQALGKCRIIPETKITEYYSDEFPIIIEHENVNISKPKLWNYEMIKDACIHISFLNTVLLQYGYHLHDGHLNNLSFHDGFPIFTDIGSITERNEDEYGFGEELVFAGISKLVFLNLNNSILKRIQIYDELNNQAWISKRFYNDMTLEFKFLFKRFRRQLFLHGMFYRWHLSNKLLKKYIVMPEIISAVFSKRLIVDTDTTLDTCMKRVTNAVNTVISNSLIVSDVGGNKGSVIQELSYSRNDCQFNYLSYDDKDSEIAYNRFKKLGITANCYLYNYAYGADDETIKTVSGDLVICNDISHNNAVYQRWKIGSLINSLTKIVRRYLCITICDSNDVIDECTEMFNRYYTNILNEKFINEKGEYCKLLLGEKND